jgi:hypothetical protein
MLPPGEKAAAIFGQVARIRRQAPCDNLVGAVQLTHRERILSAGQRGARLSERQPADRFPGGSITIPFKAADPRTTLAEAPVDNCVVVSREVRAMVIGPSAV